MSSYKYLFSPLKIGNITVKNRILSTGHMTSYVKGGLPTEQLIAYHRERAKGGAGLIIMEANAIHPTAFFTDHTIEGYKEEVLPYYEQLAAAVHPYGSKMFVQLFHPGREVFPSGTSVAVCSSTVPNERFRVMPKELEVEEIREIVKGYGDVASRVKRSGLDGVEIVASHGYLISQFWSPRVNLRNDAYGGSVENRMRFLREIVEAIRLQVGADFVVGLRLSVDDFEAQGASFDEVLENLRYADSEIGGLDFFDLTGGSSATLSSSAFIAPPAPIPPAHLASYAGRVRAAVSVPVFVTNRINDPAIAEKVLGNGQADMVGMTRAMICDPHMPNKALREEQDRIRACVGCNQACIGHMHNNLPISCVQNPVTGSEIQYAEQRRAKVVKQVVVVGGGPAGMKAAVIAAERGHKVTLFEKDAELGGQVRLARKIQGREEFGEIISNLKRELVFFRVNVRLNTEATPERIQELKPDEVVIATGAKVYVPTVEGIGLPHVATSWEILEGKKDAGKRVVIADWKGDMPGVGLALNLKDASREVELVTQCYQVGFSLQQYVRDFQLAQLHLKGVKLTPHYRLSKVNPSSVTFENIYSGQKMIREGIDTLVLATGHEQKADLYYQLKGAVPNLYRVGDCKLPRTVEEAILEGFQAAVTL